MPRVGRQAPGGYIYHVLNRGNRRERLFHKSADYDAFLRILIEVLRAVPGVRLLAFCLMPNHWHLVLLPSADGELSSFMLRLTTMHVRRLHAHRRSGDRDGGGGGHIYQGRFKSFPVQEGDELHLQTLLRYVEANALRAKLARRARDWRWCSLRLRLGLLAQMPEGSERLLSPLPIDLPSNWEATVDEKLPEAQTASIRTSIARGRPYGSAAWVERTAKRLGLQFTLRPRGRPPKTATKRRRRMAGGK
jgi:putative transposase